MRPSITLALLLLASHALAADCPPKPDDPCFAEQSAVCRDESLGAARLARDKRALEACRKSAPASRHGNRRLPPWRKP